MGRPSYVDSLNLSLGVEGSPFQATDPAAPSPDILTPTLATGGLFVYSPAVIYNETLDRAVYATNDLDTVKYAYRADATPTAAELNNVANWQTERLLSSPEGDNDETALSSGPSGILLTYKWFVPNDNRLGLRKFDPVSNTFGGPLYIEGANPIDNNSLDYPYHSQDGSGRIHVVWRSLHDDGRLRYSRSDDGGATFSAAANLAIKESFIDPIVEAASTGAGFAAWKGTGSSAIRVVPIDPQPEPSGPGGGPDTTAPTAGGFSIGDSTLFPGAGHELQLQLERVRRGRADDPEAGQGPEGEDQGPAPLRAADARSPARPAAQRRQRRGVPAPAAPEALHGLQADRVDPADRLARTQHDSLQRPDRRAQTAAGALSRSARDHRHRRERLPGRADQLPRAAQAPLGARVRQECRACR